jgi:hypothetical protein
VASTKVPPAKAARVVERARHHLNRLHQRMVPPHAAMMDLIMGGLDSPSNHCGGGSGRCRRARAASAVGR